MPLLVRFIGLAANTDDALLDPIIPSNSPSSVREQLLSWSAAAVTAGVPSALPPCAAAALHLLGTMKWHDDECDRARFVLSCALGGNKAEYSAPLLGLRRQLEVVRSATRLVASGSQQCARGSGVLTVACSALVSHGALATAMAAAAFVELDRQLVRSSYFHSPIVRPPSLVIRCSIGNSQHSVMP